MKTAQDMLDVKGGGMLTVSEESTVFESLKLMTEKRIGAILVGEGGDIKGIWTERDLTRNTVADGFDPKKTKMKDVMITKLRSCPHTANILEMMDMFLGLRLRHLLVTKDGAFVGMLSAGDVMRASLAEKSRELEELNAIFKWEYYEDWRWKQSRPGSQ